MFGCVVAGRPLQTGLKQIDETRGILELPQASKINHICVFLLGTVFFPDGYGATVHFSWPGKGFQLLGSLSNDKPSAIFRVRGLFVSADTTSPVEGQGEDVTAVLGIAIETLAEIEQQLASKAPAGDMPWLRSTGVTSETALALRSTISREDATELAMRLLKNLREYILSFSGDTGIVGVGTGGAPEGYVPVHVISRWIESTMKKIRSGGVGYLYRTTE